MASYVWAVPESCCVAAPNEGLLLTTDRSPFGAVADCVKTVPAPPSCALAHVTSCPVAVRAMDDDSVVQPVRATRPPPPPPPAPQKAYSVPPPLADTVPDPVVVMTGATIQTEPPEPPPSKVEPVAPFAEIVPSTVTVGATILIAPPP